MTEHTPWLFLGSCPSSTTPGLSPFPTVPRPFLVLTIAACAVAAAAGWVSVTRPSAAPSTRGTSRTMTTMPLWCTWVPSSRQHPCSSCAAPPASSYPRVIRAPRATPPHPPHPPLPTMRKEMAGLPTGRMLPRVVVGRVRTQGRQLLLPTVVLCARRSHCTCMRWRRLACGAYLPARRTSRSVCLGEHRWN